MKFNVKFNLRKTISLTTLSTLFVSNATQAVQSINIQTFNPSTSDHFVLLEDALRSEWPKTAKFYFGANYNYVSEPLVALNPTHTAKAFDIVERLQTIDLFFGFKPTEKFGLYFGAPIHFVGYPSSPAVGLPGGSATAFGDLKIMGKVRLTNDTSSTALALIPEIHLPTGDTENFVSDASTYLALRLALEHQFDAWTLNVNMGFAGAPNSVYQDFDYRRRFLFGIGGFMPFTDKWGMNLEFNSIHMLPFSSAFNPNELYAGLRHQPSDNLVVTLGGSLGKIGGPSGQDYRIIAGLRYTWYEEEKQAPVAAPAYTPAPTPGASSASVPKAVMRAKHIEILQPINFEHNSARLLYDAKGVLDDVASVMKKYKSSFNKILIDGHTNQIGDDQYNVKLSMARALSVKNYLISKGIPAAWMEARGFGFRKPKVPDTDPNAVDINRRVEFIVVK